MFDDHGDDDLRIIDGRPTDKPSVMLEVRGQVFRVPPLLEANHLSGSRLSGHPHAVEGGAPAGFPLVALGGATSAMGNISTP